MRVLICPDSHKGGPTAIVVADTIKRAWLSVRDRDHTTILAIADGGEGTAAILAEAENATPHVTRVTGSLGEPIHAAWFLSKDTGTAIIELAQSGGLALVEPTDRDIRRATTRGLGECVKAALETGATNLILTLGGSSSNDGGAGFAAALGAQATNAAGKPCADGGVDLLNAVALKRDLNPLCTHVKSVKVAVDVHNFLVGDQGAAAVFGPQKGATTEDIPLLDAAMEAWLKLCDMADFTGAGAAGGTAVGIKCIFPDATFTSGINLVLDTVGFDDALGCSDLVLTSEGCFDAQTMAGKAISGIAARAHTQGIPVIIIAGMVSNNLEASDIPAGITRVLRTTTVPISSIPDRIANLYKTTQQVARDYTNALKP